MGGNGWGQGCKRMANGTGASHMLVWIPPTTPPHLQMEQGGDVSVHCGAFTLHTQNARARTDRQTDSNTHAGRHKATDQDREMVE